MSTEISLVIAARTLGLGYHATLNAILRGEIEGRQDERWRWRVSVESVDRLRSKRTATPEADHG